MKPSSSVKIAVKTIEKIHHVKIDTFAWTLKEAIDALRKHFDIITIGKATCIREMPHAWIAGEQSWLASITFTYEDRKGQLTNSPFAQKDYDGTKVEETSSKKACITQESNDEKACR